MSDLPKPPYAIGEMSKSGTTTVVYIRKPEIEPLDKKILCKAMCRCDKTPDIGIKGSRLKQSCVAGHMKALDETLLHRSPYKQEVNYDMSQSPPSPIMDREIDTKGHDWLKGWIKKYWGTKPEHQVPYVPRIGNIRRPDVIIVKDPTKPPTQDNIKQIVEMKFPPDSLSDDQRLDYETIAGDERKLISIEPRDCDCDSPEPNAPAIPLDKLAFAAAAAAWLAYIAGRIRGLPMPVPAY
jgi:hypothetical protein